MPDEITTPDGDEEGRDEAAAADGDASPDAQDAASEDAAPGGADGAAPEGGDANEAVDGAPASATAGEPGGGQGLSPQIAGAVGEGAERLPPFARHAAEVLVVGLESVVSHPATIHDATAALTEYPAIERDFSELDHVGFELRVALSETEVFLASALMPLHDVGILFAFDASAEQMADDDLARAQLETVAASIRELLDLVSLTLFADGLAGAEVTLADFRRGQIDYSMGMLADVAQGAPPVRVDFGLLLPDERVAHLTLVIPATLLSRLAELLGLPGESPAAQVEEPEAAEAAAPPPPPAAEPLSTPGSREPGGFGLSDEALNVTPLHGGAQPPWPDADSGAAEDDEHEEDVPVHPVRFAPLSDTTDMGGAAGAPQSFDLIMDVSMKVTVELGRSSMTVEELLALGPGSVVELNKLSGEPVDVLVNDRLIARGEVVVVDENFGVRVTEIVSPRNRAHAMGR